MFCISVKHLCILIMEHATIKQKKYSNPSVKALHDRGLLYIPDDQKKRILRMYGNATLLDFDQTFGLNKCMGERYPTSFQTMMYYMNELEGDLSDQFDKLTHVGSPYKVFMRDMFNIVQSAVRSRIGEREWYYTKQKKHRYNLRPRLDPD